MFSGQAIPCMVFQLSFCSTVVKDIGAMMTSCGTSSFLFKIENVEEEYAWNTNAQVHSSTEA
jgi:hypothetical protein